MVKVVNPVNLYSYIFFNVSYLSEESLESLLKELELDFLASYLKYKFKDSRSIKTLKSIIKQELKRTV